MRTAGAGARTRECCRGRGHCFSNGETTAGRDDIVNVGDVDCLQGVTISKHARMSEWSGRTMQHDETYPAGTIGRLRVSSPVVGSTLFAMANALLKTVLTSSKEKVDLRDIYWVNFCIALKEL